ncbi:hydroxyisourate hydrolase [Mycolicibacterium mageritense DSM 44476 = CIP 104973]|jgi:5-hydroxyisourate hydrolase|uniref:5-hydroxyisourate hydrolase n=1 Tax=Mycolicibacterium mageritense TaxID=53462 RepID=A0ABN5YGE7_MYCME|nr:hydroxyisourate hydrolase [Mycolicibacterium mageritense]OKH69912.1 5-hydroxyisourate hydrolase [Mycobacterium sp. SWH-M3]MCC9181720.1 hydroxyisourate hydrolase [Mycolicibacterium mageritense]TXI63014.1 MAG: hydroxyisourate hydrolase [Mycolicibacterium mageritense]CDO26702.1 transthyretin [Mycolicibacterium mageritense DSM 44476 = CIP 104973]BBX37075.1 5-hydroxyisourate hydrolase [Mycolicibacterium mageritense]
MSYITTHVLDATAGRPASGIAVTLSAVATGEQIATGVTDADGRIADLGPDRLESGHYRVDFNTGDYFAARGQDTFYPQVSITFSVSADQAHYHVPLLLSPFAYSTYRGS